MIYNQFIVAYTNHRIYKSYVYSIWMMLKHTNICPQSNNNNKIVWRVENHEVTIIWVAWQSCLLIMATMYAFYTKVWITSRCLFIFECVVERLEVKHTVYKEIKKYCKKFNSIASSTSAISANDLAEGLVQMDKLSVAHS